MIGRYTYPEMRRIWEPENKFAKWLEIELYACEAWSELGRIPKDAIPEIRRKAAFSVDRIDEIEKTVDHDVIAFLTCVAENVGEESKYIHLGMTSSDVVDTAFCVLLKEAADILIGDLKALREAVAKKAAEHRYTLMIGRTHGIHAEPMTFGLKMLLWLAEIDRNLERMEAARKTVSVGKISGAVGTYAHIDPFIERYVCNRMGLEPSPISTQIIQRDRHAQFSTTLAVVAGSIEKFATEIRNLQRTDIREAEEFFAKGQKGSSAMPHKRNPITCERIAGLSRVLRGNALAALENVSLWHERDITHSSVERVIMPDSATLLDYMLRKFTGIVEKLNVYPENMMRNLESTGGLIFSQVVLLNLIDKGMLREKAYEIVQRNAMKAWQESLAFKELIAADPDVQEALTADEVKGCFDYSRHLRRIDEIYARFGL